MGNKQFYVIHDFFAQRPQCNVSNESFDGFDRKLSTFGMGGVARKDPLMSQSSFQALLNIAGLVRTLP